MTITGFWPILLVGVLGALISELIRIAGALRSGTRPTALEYIASAIYVALGAAVVLFIDPKSSPTALQVALTGAAVPLLFSNGIKAVVGPSGARPEAVRTVPLLDWLAGRF